MSPPSCGHCDAEEMVRIVGFKQGEGNDLVERASPIDMMELASDVGPVRCR